MTYANVMATLAVFIALGGSSYAALSISGRDVRNNSLRSADIRNNDLRSRDVRNGGLLEKDLKPNGVGGKAIKESALGQVPSAAFAERLGGKTAAELTVRCPVGTRLKGGGCIETAASGPRAFLDASATCDNRGRFLPSYVQLRNALRTSTVQLAAGGEFTSDVFENPLEVVVIVDFAGGVVNQAAIGPATRAFRCVAPLAN